MTVAPKRIGRYEVVHPLATGGMAEILLACLKGPRAFERLVVIKRILPHLAKEPHFVQMFVDEARNLARITHPNVVQISDFGSDDGEVFLAMEYVAGENLATLMRELAEHGEELDPALAAFIVAEACAGLHAAHDLKDADGTPLSIVHRDISPQNLLLTYGGHVKVVDFGIALSADRSTRSDTGSLKGKLEYMSPEQTRGASLDRRSDVFSIGIVLHELITGRRLYEREGHAQVVEAICLEPPVPPSRVVMACPARLDEIVTRALEKSADDRHPSAAALRKDLLEIPRVADPTEALAAMMERLFATRIAQKLALVASVASSDSIAEITRIVAQPLVAAPPIAVVAAHTAASPAVPSLAPPALLPTLLSNDPPPLRARRGWGSLVLTAAVLAVLLFGSLVASRVLRARAVARAAPAAVPSAQLPAVATSEPLLDAGAPVGILVTVKTVPPGARVLVDGAWRGDTPAEISLPKSATPSELVVERAGFVPVTQTLPMDRDQSVFLSLVAVPRSRASRSPRGPAAPRPSASNFWRFE